MYASSIFISCKSLHFLSIYGKKNIEHQESMACKYPQRRNPRTGRCKKPCARHEAVNPATGRCVTKSYLKSLRWRGYDSDDEFSYFGYKPYSDDLDDGLVSDSSCKPPKKLNIFTGKCKTPCGPHRMRSPRTGQCVTKRFLRSLDYNMYDTDDDDYLLSETLFYPRMSYIDMIARSNGKKKLTELVQESGLTVNDITVMLQVKIGAEMGRLNLYGVYDRKSRMLCDESTIHNFVKDLTSGSKCGLSMLKSISEPNYIDLINNTLKEAARRDNAFAFICFPDTINLFNDYFIWTTRAAKEGVNAKLLVLGRDGIWQILVPKNSDVTIPVFPTSLDPEELAKHIVDNSRGDLSVAFHRFNKTSV